ncbi:proteasome subunit alpha type-3-like [Zophobas morio]|uniref:proteasome subunit alpha type-3-like n=1 Tax=Zophobas morio TaxID=2755281 RepID=UPI0030836885
MSSLGTGYDFSAMTFSPDGRVFQVEYAAKAVENSGTAVAIRCVDGVVFGVEKIIFSKLLETSSNHRNFTIDKHTGLSFSGLAADARHLVNRARTEASNFKTFYGREISGKLLAQRLAQYIQNYTLYSFVRPFGCSLLLGKHLPNEKPSLFVLEPSGNFFGYKAYAVGRRKQQACTELGKLALDSITMKEALVAIARIIYTIYDESKDKEFSLEMSWIGSETQFKHEIVPQGIVDSVINSAKQKIS